MLLNWADTLDDVFTLAHEMGHSMHTMLSHERQPFVYSDYTIFVAEVPSTLAEALLLEHLLATTTDRQERIVLLQHAIDNITSTFYTQVLFADFELATHTRVEQDGPITAEVLNELYRERFDAYYGDSVDMEELTPITWARIPTSSIRRTTSTSTPPASPRPPSSPAKSAKGRQPRVRRRAPAISTFSPRAGATIR